MSNYWIASNSPNVSPTYFSHTKSVECGIFQQVGGEWELVRQLDPNYVQEWPLSAEHLLEKDQEIAFQVKK